MRKLCAMCMLFFLLCALVEVHSETAPYITFMGETLSNHSYVDLGLVGGADSGSEVVCHTDLPTCCGGFGFDDRGHWYFPNGTKLPGALHNQGASLVEKRHEKQVDLRRGTGSGHIPSGIYRCDIETLATKVNGDDGHETMYIGVYENGGNITIPESIMFTNVSDLNGDNPQFTLTCASTGGPATSVTWTRDAGNAEGESTTVLTNTTTTSYTHTLTVTGRLEGLYQCTVSNGKPSIAASELRVQAPSPPSDLTVFQNGEDSVLVSWTRLAGEPAVTGYSISYHTQDGEQALNFSDSASTASITNLANGVTYNIKFVVNSTTLPSIVSELSITIGSYALPVENFVLTSSSPTSLIFTWIPPITATNNNITGYNLTCMPLLKDIPTPDTLELGPNISAANVTGLYPGVAYNCSIVSLIASKSSEPYTLTSMTMEIAPTGHPVMFAADARQREVNFTWSPPSATQHNVVITHYTLSCSPSPPSLPQTTSHPGPLTLTGFSPDTSYSCSVEASNSQGSGPPANTTFTTQQDNAYIQLRLFGAACLSFVANESDVKLADISTAILKELNSSCQCNSTSVTINHQFFKCSQVSPHFVTYRAQIKGTAEVDSVFLISLIESWAMDRASVIVGGILMTVDSNCSVNIASLDEEECSVSENSTPESSDTIFIIAAISGWSVAGALVAGVAIVAAVCVVKRCCRKQSVQKTEHNIVLTPRPPLPHCSPLPTAQSPNTYNTHQHYSSSLTASSTPQQKPGCSSFIAPPQPEYSHCLPARNSPPQTCLSRSLTSNHSPPQPRFNHSPPQPRFSRSLASNHSPSQPRFSSSLASNLSPSQPHFNFPRVYNLPQPGYSSLPAINALRPGFCYPPTSNPPPLGFRSIELTAYNTTQPETLRADRGRLTYSQVCFSQDAPNQEDDSYDEVVPPRPVYRQAPRWSCEAIAELEDNTYEEIK